MLLKISGEPGCTKVVIPICAAFGMTKLSEQPACHPAIDLPVEPNIFRLKVPRDVFLDASSPDFAGVEGLI
jgi:hypothetical protein